MDDARFDCLTRTLVTATSRRTTLLAFLGSALSAPLIALSGADTEAKRKHRKKKRKKKKNGGNNPPPPPPPPPPGCPSGQVDCSGQCVDLRTDPNNCGACGVVSPTGECRNGAFVCENLEGDCPEGCNCKLAGPSGVCATNPPICTDIQCGGDEDCPLGSACVCISVFAPAFCSNLCTPD